MTELGLAADGPPADEPSPARLLSPDEVAEFLGVSKETVMDLAQGRGGVRALPAVHINRRVVRFKPADVLEFVEAQRAVAKIRLSDQLPRKKAPSPVRRIGRTA